MLIRAAAQPDAAMIGQLWLDLVQHHRQLDARMPVPAADGAHRYAARISSSLEDTHTRVFVAEADNRLMGYAVGVVVDLLPEMFAAEYSGFLADIYVVPEARGQGVGRALVEAIRLWFRGRGITYFEWHVAAANADAQAFWRAVGGADLMIRMRAPTATA